MTSQNPLSLAIARMAWQTLEPYHAMIYFVPAVEDRTDLLALPPWQHLGQERTTRLLKLVEPLSASILKQDGIPMPNPMGLRQSRP